MPTLTNPKMEAYAQALAKGEKQVHAYRNAGYSGKSSSGPSALASDPRVAGRVAELISQSTANHQHVEHLAIARAVERTAISKEKIFNEFGSLGFSNMLDYMRLQADGSAVFDWSRLTRDQAAAIVEVTVEEFMDGRGEDARPVRRVKFKLADKIAALSKLGQELGMFIEHRRVEILPLEQRLAQMTDEQRMEEAKQLAARIRRKLDEDIAKNGPIIEGEVTDVTPELETDGEKD